MTPRVLRQKIDLFITDYIYFPLRLYKISDLYYVIKRIPRKIKKILRWLPTIYKFEPWDYWFLLDIFHKAVKEQLDFYNSDDVLMDNSKTVNDLTELSQILIRLKDHDEYSKHIKRPKSINRFKLTPVKAKDGFILYYEQVSKLSKKHIKYFTTTFKLESKGVKKDLNRLGKILLRIENWWE